MSNAVIENGRVVNIIEGSIPDTILIPNDGTAQIGYLWSGSHPFRPPTISLKQAIAEKLAALEIFWNKKISDGTTVNGDHIDTDQTTITNLNSIYIVTNTDNSPPIFNWRMSTGWKSFTREQIIILIPAVAVWVQAGYTNFGVHFTNIEALTTISAVDAYDFGTGWPTGT